MRFNVKEYSALCMFNRCCSTVKGSYPTGSMGRVKIQIKALNTFTSNGGNSKSLLYALLKVRPSWKNRFNDNNPDLGIKRFFMMLAIPDPFKDEPNSIFPRITSARFIRELKQEDYDPKTINWFG